MLTGPRTGGPKVAVIISCIFPPEPGLRVTFSSVAWCKTLTFLVMMNSHKTDELLSTKRLRLDPGNALLFIWGVLVQSGEELRTGADTWCQDSGFGFLPAYNLHTGLVWRSYRSEEIWGGGGRGYSPPFDSMTLICLGQVKACLVFFQIFPKECVPSPSSNI